MSSASESSKTTSTQAGLLASRPLKEDGDWEVLFRGGATGTVAWKNSAGRDGKPALRLSKTNALGYVELRSKSPVQMEQGKRYTFSGYFQSQDAPLSSLLLFRLGPKEAENFANPYGLYNYTLGSFIPNTPSDYWERRVVNYEATDQPNADVNIARNVSPSTHAHVLLVGNPCSVTLSDLDIAFARATASLARATMAVPFTREQVASRLAKRSPATLQLSFKNGRATILENGKVAAPAMYMAIRTNANEGDYAGFGQAGINNIVVPVNLNGEERIWTGEGKYDFDRVDEALLDALQRNPDANLMLLLSVQSYPGWGAKHPDEVWQNAAGAKGVSRWGSSNLWDFTQDISKLDAGLKADYYPSYHSRLWRQESQGYLKALVEHIRAQEYGKVVVGAQIFVGTDGRMQLGDSDYSPAAVNAFHSWLTKKYGSIGKLNAVWKTKYAAFEAVKVPDAGNVPIMSADTVGKPYIFESDVIDYLDYRSFRRADAWSVMDGLAGTIKTTLGKPSIVSIYRDLEPEFLASKNVDLIANDSFYPFRRPGYSTAGWERMLMASHRKMQFQDLDLRSFAGPQNVDEEDDQWMGAALTKTDWTATHKKMVGLSLADDSGYWYYEMWGYHTDPWITQQIGKTTKVAQRVAQMNAADTKPFHPDVLVVQSGDVSNYRRVALHNTVKGFGTGDLSYEFEMMFETSGVPYRSAYLRDVITQPELQNYRVYVIPHAVSLSNAERAFLEKLKSGGRTIVWVHDTGYIGENGPNVAAMSKLIGMTVKTEEKYARLTPLLKANTPLTRGALPLQGVSELTYNNFSLKGFDPGKAPGQPFWIEDASAQTLVTYHETGQVAGAVKKFPNWTSIYLAAPSGLGNDLLNNIAKQAGAYVAAPAGNQINLNRHFASIHGLRSGNYPVKVPQGTRRVTEADTRREFSLRKDGTVVVPVVARQTYWLLFE